MVTKEVPQRVEVSEELTAPVVVPPWPMRALVNGDLSNWIKTVQARVEEANERLDRIRELTHEGEQ